MRPLLLRSASAGYDTGEVAETRFGLRHLRAEAQSLRAGGWSNLRRQHYNREIGERSQAKKIKLRSAAFMRDPFRVFRSFRGCSITLPRLHRPLA